MANPVLSRPIALLDGNTEPARLVIPNSDAERYYDQGKVEEKLGDFANMLILLTNLAMPRLGHVRYGEVEDGVYSFIQGEDDANNVMYGFRWAKEVLEAIELSRVENGTVSKLAIIAFKGDDATYVQPDFRGKLNDSEREETRQLLAIGMDEAEWALD